MEINRLLVAVVILFAFFIIKGYRKGFFRIIISFTGTIVVIIAVAAVSPMISRYIRENTDLYEHTREKVINVFMEKISSDKDDADVKDLDLPDIIMKDIIEKNATEMFQALLATLFRDYISGYIAGIIINAGSFVGTYIALSIVLWILLRTSDIITKIPIVKGLNRFLGMLVGFGEAVIIVWIVFIIIIMFLGDDIGSTLLKDIRDSRILSFLFNNNYLFRFIT
jgi:uncharacterized membrane protein required for colicin V production